jgi:hypothetical protein
MFVPSEESNPLYIINHLVSADKQKVYVRIELFDKSAEISPQEILSYLTEQEIVFGIRENDIIEYCKKKDYLKELTAASGKKPTDGKDAEMVYNFDTKTETKFLENDDGTIDFRNLNNVINVKKDTVLCHIIPPVEGEDGIDVYGNSIPYKRGKNISFNYGSNTYVSQDGLQLLASMDGCVEFKNGKVFVENVYRVNNVDNSTGNIDFIGNVVVNGDVKEGFSINAKGDIKIWGMVEGAYIKSDGEVVINKGMNGMGKGSIYAKGNITSKYIENASIVSEKSIYAHALINSEVKAGESVIVKGSNSTIIGGITSAKDTIYAKTIGSKTNPETNIVIDLSNYYEEQKLMAVRKHRNLHYEKQLLSKNKEFKELEEKIAHIMKLSLSNENKSVVQKQLMLRKIKLNNEIKEITSQLHEVKSLRNSTDYKIVCTGIIYSNTRIDIGGIKYRVRGDISYSKVYNDGRDIAVVPLNPGDIDI